MPAAAVRALRLLLLALLACAFAWFAVNNWTWVQLVVLPGRELFVRLPALLFATLLVGALPPALLYSLARWRWRRELDRARRREAAALAAPAAAGPPPPAPANGAGGTDLAVRT